MRTPNFRIWCAASGAALLASCAAALAEVRLPEFAAVNFTDVLGDVSGGLKRQARILDKADVTATWLGEDSGWPGLTLFVDGQVSDAANFSGAVVGDAQSISNLDGPAGVRLVSAWVARDFDGKGGVKAGVIDLNTEFDVQATAALFLNASFGIGPDFSQSGLNGPSIYPSTGLGFVGWWLPGDHWSVKAGVFEGTPGDPAHPGRTQFDVTSDEGALLVLEVRNHITPDFVLGAGTWRYTSAFDAIDPALGRLYGNAGYYAIADGLLWSPADAEKDDKTGLSGWLRIGFADDRINTFESSYGGGLVYTAPFGRMSDQAGLAFARVQFGDPARQAGALELAETTWEATYSFNVNEHLSLQPDIQYVISPGGDPAIADALVVGSRVVATW